MQKLFDFKISELPPSINRIYKIGRSKYGSAHIYKDPEAKCFEEIVLYSLPRAEQIINPCRLEIEFIAKENIVKKRDLDNMLKLLCDSIQSAGLLKNDNLIYEISCKKIAGDKNNTKGTFYLL